MRLSFSILSLGFLLEFGIWDFGIFYWNLEFADRYSAQPADVEFVIFEDIAIFNGCVYNRHL
jgi:hypothetical protein